MSEPHTAIILLNWNGWKDTVACLESLLQLTQQTFTVVVCDNASEDDSWERIHSWCELQVPGKFAHWTSEDVWNPTYRIALIQTGANLGFAGGCNVGIRFALQQTRCNYLWLLNNDTVVHPDALAAQLKCMQHDGTVGLLGSTLAYYQQPDRVQCFGGYGFNFWTGRVRPLPFAADIRQVPKRQAVEALLRYVSGASTFTTRAFVESVGLLNEQYFLYFEEIDWAVRGRNFRLSYCPESIVLHKEGQSIGSNTSAERRSSKSERWLTRNRILFLRTHFPSHVPVALLWVFCVALLRGAGRPALAITLVRALWSGLTAPIQPVPKMLNEPHATQGAATRQAAAASVPATPGEA